MEPSHRGQRHGNRGGENGTADRHRERGIECEGAWVERDGRRNRAGKKAGVRKRN